MPENKKLPKGLLFTTWKDVTEWVDDVAIKANKSKNTEKFSASDYDLRYQGKNLLLALVQAAAKEKPPAEAKKKVTLKKLLQLYLLPLNEDPSTEYFPVDENGRTVLHHLCAQADKASLDLLFETLKNIGVQDQQLLNNIVNQKDLYGATPLHALTRSSVDVTDAALTEMAGLLIEKGADVNAATTLLGNTPLHFASLSGGKIELIKKLVENNADVNQKNENDETPVHKALKGRTNEGSANLLIQNGADITRENKQHQTAMDVAAEQIRRKGRVSNVVEAGLSQTACPAQTFGSTGAELVPRIPDMKHLAMVNGIFSAAASILFFIPNMVVDWRQNRGEVAQQNIQAGLVQQYLTAGESKFAENKKSFEQVELTIAQVNKQVEKPGVNKDFLKIENTSLDTANTSLQELQTTIQKSKALLPKIELTTSKYIKEKEKWKALEANPDQTSNSKIKYTSWKDKMAAFFVGLGQGICFGGGGIGTLSLVNFIPFVGQAIFVIGACTIGVLSIYVAYRSYTRVLEGIGEVNQKNHELMTKAAKAKADLLKEFFGEDSTEFEALAEESQKIQKLRDYVIKKTSGIFADRGLKNAKGEAALAKLKELLPKLKIELKDGNEAYNIEGLKSQEKFTNLTVLGLIDKIAEINNKKISDLEIQLEKDIQKKQEEIKELKSKIGSIPENSLGKELGEAKQELAKARQKVNQLSAENARLQVENIRLLEEMEKLRAEKTELKLEPAQSLAIPSSGLKYRNVSRNSYGDPSFWAHASTLTKLPGAHSVSSEDHKNKAQDSACAM